MKVYYSSLAKGIKVILRKRGIPNFLLATKSRNKDGGQPGQQNGKTKSPTSKLIADVLLKKTWTN